MCGGRTLLVKLLKGSRDKDILAKQLEDCPVYGRFRHLPREEVRAKIDWIIVHNYLAIEYDHHLPLLVYTKRGWVIERDTYASQLHKGFDDLLPRGGPYDMSYLKDRARDMICLLLDKVEQTGGAKYIPLLEAWAHIDYKKSPQQNSRGYPLAARRLPQQGYCSSKRLIVF